MDWEDMEEILSKSEISNLEETSVFKHDDLSDRLKKTLYYSPHKKPNKDTLSFSLTREAVESFRKAAPSSFGKLGHRYASRVARDACISPCSLLLGMIYIERLAHRNPTYLQKVSSSDLFLISMMIATKYLQDEGIEDEVFNDEWAASGLVDVDYVNNLEADFLKAIDWRVLVRQLEFRRVLQLTELSVAKKQVNDRGWCSYTDLQCLICSHKIAGQLLQQLYLLSKAVCACMVVYSGTVLVATGTFCAIQTSHIGLKQNYPLDGAHEFGPQNFIGPKHSVVDCNKTDYFVPTADDHDKDISEIQDLSEEPPVYTIPEKAALTPTSSDASDDCIGQNLYVNSYVSMMETVFFLSNVSVICYNIEEAEQMEVCPYCKKHFKAVPDKNAHENCHSCTAYEEHKLSGNGFYKRSSNDLLETKELHKPSRKKSFHHITPTKNPINIYHKFKQPVQITVF